MFRRASLWPLLRGHLAARDEESGRHQPLRSCPCFLFLDLSDKAERELAQLDDGLGGSHSLPVIKCGGPIIEGRGHGGIMTGGWDNGCPMLRSPC